MSDEELELEDAEAAKYYNDGCIEMDCARYEEAIDLFYKAYGILASENKENSDLAESCMENVELCLQYIDERNIANEIDRKIYIGTKEYPFGRYEGEMFEGIECGNGKFYFNNGIVIEGVFEQNYCQGTCVYPEIGVYRGEFLNFKKHGEGVFTLNDGRKCMATWNEDFFDGRVIYVDEAGRTEIKYYKNGVETRRNTSNRR